MHLYKPIRRRLYNLYKMIRNICSFCTWCPWQFVLILTQITEHNTRIHATLQIRKDWPVADLLTQSIYRNGRPAKLSSQRARVQLLKTTKCLTKSLNFESNREFVKVTWLFRISEVRKYFLNSNSSPSIAVILNLIFSFSLVHKQSSYKLFQNIEPR